ncbi:MAG: LamG domain-containing protein [Bacteroidales bacterium]
MKKFFKISGALFVIMLVFGLILSSCKKDEDDPNAGKTDPTTIATANLIAYFPFEAEPAIGAAVEKSNSTITYVKKVGGASFVTGRRGNGYQGSATQSYLEYNITAGTTLKTLDEFSLACWIKTPNTTSGAAKIFSINGGDSFMGNLALIQESRATGDSVDMKLYLFDSASPDWKGQDIRKQSDKFLNDKWFHVVSVYRKATSEMEFYANGKRVFSQIRYAGPVPVSGPQPLLGTITLGSDMTKIHFGAWAQQIAGTPESWMNYYKGIVDEFRIYNKALSTTEIKSLYDAEITQINP